MVRESIFPTGFSPESVRNNLFSHPALDGLFDTVGSNTDLGAKLATTFLGSPVCSDAFQRSNRAATSISLIGWHASECADAAVEAVMSSTMAAKFSTDLMFSPKEYGVRFISSRSMSKERHLWRESAYRGLECDQSRGRNTP